MTAERSRLEMKHIFSNTIDLVVYAQFNIKEYSMTEIQFERYQWFQILFARFCMLSLAFWRSHTLMLKQSHRQLTASIRSHKRDHFVCELKFIGAKKLWDPIKKKRDLEHVTHICRRSSEATRRTPTNINAHRRVSHFFVCERVRVCVTRAHFNCRSVHEPPRQMAHGATCAQLNNGSVCVCVVTMPHARMRLADHARSAQWPQFRRTTRNERYISNVQTNNLLCQSSSSARRERIEEERDKLWYP